MTRYWTIVYSEHPDNEHPGLPVKPNDDNTHDDEGMLVYCSKDAADSAALFQFDQYDIHCHAVPIGQEIDGIKSTPFAEEMLAAIIQAVYVWEAIGFHHFSRTAARAFNQMVTVAKKAKGEVNQDEE